MHSIASSTTLYVTREPSLSTLRARSVSQCTDKINSIFKIEKGAQWFTWLEHWADDQQARVRDPVAAMGQGELPSLTPAPTDSAVQKGTTMSK